MICFTISVALPGIYVAGGVMGVELVYPFSVLLNVCLSEMIFRVDLEKDISSSLEHTFCISAAIIYVLYRFSHPRNLLTSNFLS